MSAISHPPAEVLAGLMPDAPRCFQRPLTVEARKYALKELARRAGVSCEFFNQWTIEISPLLTTVLFALSAPKIHFPHCTVDALSAIRADDIPVGKSLWPCDPGSKWFEADLLTPFAPSESVGPLFQRNADGSHVCRVDLLLSILFTLTRVEESLSTIRDEHARFPSSASIALQHGFLERPIVDECALAFAQILRTILPNWRPQLRSLRINLTHDIDEIGIPFRLSTTLAHTLKRGKPAASLQDLSATFSSREPAELAQVRLLADISKARNLQSSFFWKASARTRYDSGYDIFHPKVQKVIGDLRAGGFTLGVHPGYNTFHSPLQLKEEVQYLRKALHLPQLGGRQHYLRWSPETWHDWETCNLQYDSSVGFADHFGFRAGTSVPYRPWSFAQNRELQLVELPLILMDCTPVKYMSLSRSEALSRIQTCLHRTAAAGGVFTLLWHNSPLLDPAYQGWYESILDLLPGTQNCDLSTSLATFY
jgi:hypothetical protein